MAGESDTLAKLPKLSGGKDFIPWKRRVKAYIQKDDIELLGLQETPEEDVSAEDLLKWKKAMFKAKYAIITTIAVGPMAQVSSIIDDDKGTAKELWDALAKIYTTSNEQTVINLVQELETLEFKDGSSWEEHLNKFHLILGKLAALDKPVPTDEKSSKLIRTLPKHFAPLAMVSSKMTFEELVNAIQTEVSRRKSRNANKGTVNVPKANAASSTIPQGNNKNKRNGRISKNKGNNNLVCWVCGRVGHRSKDCFYRADRLVMNNRGSQGFGRGNRGRHDASPRGLRGGGGVWNGNGRQGHGQYNHLTPQHNQGTNGSQSNWNAHDPDSGQLANQANLRPPNAQGPQLNQDGFSAPGNAPYGFMAKIKFKTTLAKCSDNKSKDWLIDSGASHHFCNNKSMFVSYESTLTTQVQAAAEVSILVGKGQIYIPLAGGLVITAYHAPHFQTNIVSVGMLTDMLNVSFSKDPPARNNVSTCLVYKRRSAKPCNMIEINSDGLYRILNEKGFSAQGVVEVARSGRNEVVRNNWPVSSGRASHLNMALEWHNKTGHPHTNRYMKLANMFENIPKFPRQVLDEMLCVPCRLAKLQRRAILPSRRDTIRPLELVHVDITGKMTTTSLGSSCYGIGFMDDFTAKSDVYFLKSKSGLFASLKYYKERAEAETGCRLINIRLDGAGENMANMVHEFALSNGIRLEPSPAHAPESNGVAERFMKELGVRARVLLFGAKLGDEMWAEAMHHGNWLRNRLPSDRIQGNIPILSWNNRTRIDFENLPTFGQHGFAFLYQPHTRRNRKLSARSAHGQFVGLESDQVLYRIYLPETKRIIITRCQDFHACTSQQLPGVSSLLDGIARQSELEASSNAQDGIAEDILAQAFHIYRPSLSFHSPTASIAKGNLKDPRLPRTFKEALGSKDWCNAIDREYSALRRRKTWDYVLRAPGMQIIPFTWVFRLKPLDNQNKSCLHRARCCARGDMQTPGVDFDPDGLYAPVASHDSIRILLSIAAADGLLVEGADICSAYLYGKLDVPVYMEQPTNSSGVQEMPGHVCRLLRSMYGLKQAGNIWCSLFIDTLTEWGFVKSKIDPRVLFKVDENNGHKEFIIVVIVVDDMKFVSNSKRMLEHFKKKLAETFDVKLFGTISSFIGWEIHHNPDGIKITQVRYLETLLAKHGLSEANGAWSPLPTDANLTKACEEDILLSRPQHANYRATIGELLYLSVCTRPDISFAVNALARNVHAPTLRHLGYVKRILRYLAGTRNLGVLYPSGKGGASTYYNIKAYADSDWAGDHDSRKSTSGLLVCMNGSPVFWKSRRQTVTALSSAEAEYIALSSCAKELVWIRRLVWELTNLQPYSKDAVVPTTSLYTDNTAAISMALRDQISAKSKHIEVKFHHVKDMSKLGILRLHHIGTANQVADILTKPVHREDLKRHRTSLLC